MTWFLIITQLIIIAILLKMDRDNQKVITHNQIVIIEQNEEAKAKLDRLQGMVNRLLEVSE